MSHHGLPSVSCVPRAFVPRALLLGACALVFAGSSVVACGSSTCGDTRSAKCTGGFADGADAGDDDIADDDLQMGDDDTSPDEDGGAFEVPDGSNISDDDAGSCAKAQAAAIRPNVDVIMAIDQSGSMLPKIQKVKDNVNRLGEYLDKTGFNYRLVMVASKGTDGFNVCVPAPLGAGPPDCGSTAKLRVVSQNVQSNDALDRIVETFSQYSDFLRKDALKVITVLTDDNADIAAPDFEAKLLALPGGYFGTAAKRNYVAYPIIGASDYPDETRCGVPFIDAVNNGPNYLALVKLTKGQWFSICSADFAPLFESMAKNIASTIACEYTVPSPPKGETLDPGKVSVLYTPGGSKTAKQIKKDVTKACASGANGWQYDSTGKKVLICGAACTTLQNDNGAKVDIRFGCAPETVN